jgi:hypothetical protein
MWPDGGGVYVCGKHALSPAMDEHVGHTEFMSPFWTRLDVAQVMRDDSSFLHKSAFV